MILQTFMSDSLLGAWSLRSGALSLETKNRNHAFGVEVPNLEPINMAHCLQIYDRMRLVEVQLYDVFINDCRIKAESR